MLTPMRIIISILLLICLGQAAALVYLLQRPPDCRLSGVVAHVTDGDTLTLDLGQTTRKIRLSEIDTPEKNQPYGAQAEQLLTTWVAGKAVRVRDEGPDKYGRTLGRVYLGEIDINAALVAYGSAWVYRQYSQDAPLITLEEQARAARRGLWALPADQQIPPWEFRHAKGAMLSDAQRSAGCQLGKRTCKDMATCEEAKFYLTTCALGKLDKDGDGVPCEALCR